MDTQQGNETTDKYIATTAMLMPYKNKYWRETKFGKLANYHAIAKYKSCQYF